MKAMRMIIMLTILLVLPELTIGTGLANQLSPSGQIQSPIGTAFTYQGYLTDGASPAEGLYDFRVGLFDVESGGNPLQTVLLGGVDVVGGYFTLLLDFGTYLDGTALWLEMEVRPTGGGSYTLMEPRQPLTAAPYATYAGYASTAPWSGLLGVPDLQLRVGGICAEGSSIREINQDGSVVCELDDNATYSAGAGLLLDGMVFSADTGYLQRRVAGTCGAGYAIRSVAEDGSVTCEPVSGGEGDITAVLPGTGLWGGGYFGEVYLGILPTYSLPQSCLSEQVAKWDQNSATWYCAADNNTTSFWSLTGNAATTPGTNYLGTSDNQPLELRVNGTRALRLEPSSTSPNLLGGNSGNWIFNGMYGATISGGGSPGNLNRVTDNFGTIAGGDSNQAGDNAGSINDNPYATVGGGSFNTAGGEHSTVDGGLGNQALGTYASIGGGRENIASDYSVTGGGMYNSASGSLSMIGGGDDNHASGQYTTIGGGHMNIASYQYATICGGSDNLASNFETLVGGGSYNIASGYGASILAGSQNTASAEGTTVGGGYQNTASGLYASVFGGWINSATGNYSTICGGSSNTSAEYGTVGGGLRNHAVLEYDTVGGGIDNIANGTYSTIGGGYANHASNQYATIGGGAGNSASASSSTTSGGSTNAATGPYSTVGGGGSNTSSAEVSTVGGGWFNIANGNYSTISGGAYNSTNAWYATISGGGATDPYDQYGTANRVTDDYGSVGGGGNNQAGDNAGTREDKKYATVSGGFGNYATGASSTIGGGHENTSVGNYSIVGGGYTNDAIGLYSSVGGGNDNTATNEAATVGGGSGNVASGIVSMVGGGVGNSAFGFGATIAGGYQNSASEGATVCGGESNNALEIYTSVGGGISNSAGGQYSTISGGYHNAASGVSSSIPGGIYNDAAGDNSFAAGTRAHAVQKGCFVWGDSTDADVSCTAENSWVARAKGGVTFYTDANQTTGVYVSAGGGSWNSVSNPALKDNLMSIDTQALVKHVAEMPITTWNYISQDESIRHIGPMADDFNALLPDLGGEGGMSINSLDADGVALASIQGLYQIIQEKETRISELEARMEALEAGQSVSTDEVSKYGSAVNSLLPAMFGSLGVAVGVLISRRKGGSA